MFSDSVTDTVTTLQDGKCLYTIFVKSNTHYVNPTVINMHSFTKIISVYIPIVPSGISPPVTTSTTSRTATLSWSVPSQPNGLITSYSIISTSPTQSTLYLGNSNILTADILNLLPYTEYAIVLRACTVVGCADSQSVSFTTDEDIPEGEYSKICLL